MTTDQRRSNRFSLGLPGIGNTAGTRGGVGMQLVETLARQIRGRHEVRAQPPEAGVVVRWREP